MTWKFLEAQSWLNQNHPRYQIIFWKSSSKVIFLDSERNVEFPYSFSALVAKLKKDPECIFSATKEEIEEKKKKSLFKKYGVENPSQLEEIKNKKKQTHIKNYGVPTPFERKEIQEKARHSQSKDQTKNKRKKTNLKKWGVEYPYQNKEVLERALQSKKENGHIKYIDGKTIPQWAQDPDLGSEMTLYYAQKVGIHPSQKKKNISLLQIKICDFLKNELRLKEVNHFSEVKNITDFTHNKMIKEQKGLPKKGRFHPDFCFPLLKLIIECDGEYYHIRTEEQILHDDLRNKVYSGHGYDVYCFSGQEILHNWTKTKQVLIQKFESYDLE